MIVQPRDLGLPYPAWRPGQAELIAQAAAAPTKYLVIEAPPGLGKTGIGVALARLLGSSAHYLTATKQLQEQYLEMPGLVQVRGRGNFPCLLEPGTSADRAACTVGGESYPECPYYVQRNAARKSAEVVFNYAYWLAVQTHGKPFPRPATLVADEAHLLRGQLQSAIAVTLRRSALQRFRLLPPDNPEDPASWVEWAGGCRRLPHIVDFRVRFRDTPPDPSDGPGVREAQSFRALDDALEALVQYQAAEWVVLDKPWGWEAKPVWVDRLARDLVYRHADRVVLMSATILSKEVYCGLHGLPLEDTTFLRAPSTFARDRRPVYYRPQETRVRRGEPLPPGLVAAVREILDAHPGESGLVHTVSHRLAQDLAGALRDPRVITHEARDRELALARFRRTPGAVLVSPSMTTGVDLPYDQCRFQVLCKLPFPDLGDPLVQRQMGDADAPWSKGRRVYTYDTATTLVQTYGRIMRAEDDRGDTYLLDPAWRWFQASAREFLPDWFREAVIWPPREPTPDVEDVLAQIRRDALAQIGG